MTTTPKFTRLVLALTLAAGLLAAVPLARATSAPWTTQYTHPAGGLKAIAFARQSPLVGYAVGFAGSVNYTGGFILATRDGAKTWQEQFACLTSSPCSASSPDRVLFRQLNAVSFADANNGYAVGSGGTILATSDGGATWRSQDSGTDKELFDVSSVVPGRAHAVGDGTFEESRGLKQVEVFATTDGRTWKAQPTGLPAGGYRFTSVSFADADKGLIAGVNQSVNPMKAFFMSTSDGGQTWTKSDPPDAVASMTLESVSFVGDSEGGHGYAVGHSDYASGHILATTDGGRMWSVQLTLTGSPQQTFHSVAFADRNHGRVVGLTGEVLATSDAGATWLPQATDTNGPFIGVEFPQINHGYALTMNAILSYDPSVEAPTPYPGTWQATSPMLLERDLHTATPLPDGRVVVIGGRFSRFTERPDHASAEVYDPDAQRWSHVGNLTTLRAGHSATLLSDGRILVAGSRISSGGGGTSNERSAEVLDPVSGRSLPTPEMANPRAGHTATLVAGGKVVVAGAYGVEEVYDPAANSWASASTRNQVSAPGSASPPAANGAILLETDCGSRCGRVLVVRGASAELYDPTTNTWSPAASPGLPAGSTAWTIIGLKDGKVMAVSDATNPFVKFYEPLSDTWTAGARPGPEMTSLSSLASAADGNVLAMFRGNDNSLRAVAYRPASASWHPAAPPLVDRYAFTTTPLPDGRVLVAGGALSSAPPFTPTSGYAELFDPGSTAPSPPQINELKPSSGRAAGDTEVTITGLAFGQDSQVFFGDVAAKAVTVVSGTQIKAVSPAHSPGVVDVTVRVPGRPTSNVHMRTGFTYAGTPLSFGPLPAMKVPRGQHGAVALPGGELLVIGGSVFHEDFAQKDAAGSSELYEPNKGENGEWRLIPRTTSVTEGVTQLRDGSVLVAQGNQAEVFSAASKTWSSVTAMGVPRTGHTATLLADGRVLVAGGERLYDEVADVPDQFIHGTGPLASAEIYESQEPYVGPCAFHAESANSSARGLAS
ncbi:MAG TPA: YCF48-related protein [Acidimicrobiales bacterium]|nr:YCF48-related protein [Acidimicrobiales bacterium]